MSCCQIFFLNNFRSFNFNSIIIWTFIVTCCCWLDGGSAYGYHNEVNRWIIVKDDGSTYDVDVDVDVEKDLASCVSDNPWKTHTFGQKSFVFFSNPTEWWSIL